MGSAVRGSLLGIWSIFWYWVDESRVHLADLATILMRDQGFKLLDPSGRAIISFTQGQIVDHEGPESMICLCTCTGVSSASPVKLKHREGSKTCRTCGGRLSLVVRGELATSIMSTVGVELSSVIDPQLNWKTTSKGRQRAVRRPRTSFTQDCKKPTSSSAKGGEGLIEKDTEGSSNMAVSEFEKLGVSVLGQRFGDSLESVPIKKRRFLLRSLSPPHELSSLSDTEQVQGKRAARHEEVASNTKLYTPNIKSGAGAEFGQQSSSVVEKPEVEDFNEMFCDSADFSGISILAAAACDSNIGCDVMNDADSVPRKSNPEQKYEHTNITEVSYSNTETLLETSGIPCEGFDVTKASGSCSPETSRSLLSVPENITIVESPSRDIRLHWDLNTVMDAWERPLNDVLNSEAIDITHYVSRVRNDNMENEKPQRKSAGSMCSSKHANYSDMGDVQVENSALAEIQMNEKTDVSDNACVVDHVDVPIQEDHKLEDASMSMKDTVKQDRNPYNQAKLVLTTGIPSLSTFDSSPATVVAVGEKGDTPTMFCVVAETEVADEAINITTASASADLDGHFVDCSPGDLNLVQVSELRSPQAENLTSLHATSINCTPDQDSVATLLTEKIYGVMVPGNISKDMFTSGISCESTHTDAIEESACGSASKYLESHTDSCRRIFIGDELSGGAYAGETKTMDADTRMQDNKCSTEVGSNVYTDSDFVICNSTNMKLAIVAAPLDVALNSNGVYKSHGGGCDASTGQVSLGDHSDCDYYSDASRDDTDQLTEMEKVDFLRDEDDQYEDGEFRESSVNRWGEDGTEDAETEHVDYGSDNNRETNIFEDASVSVHFDGVNGNPGLSDVNCYVKYGEQARKVMRDADSLPLVKCSSDGVSAKRTKDGSREFERDTKDVVDPDTIRAKEFLSEEVASMKSSHLPSFRAKSSGWDRLPESCRSFESRSVVVVSGADPGCRNTDSVLGRPNAGEAFRREDGSSPRRDISSQVDRPKSSDVSCRKDNFYARGNRSNDHNDLNSRVERNTHPRRPIGRGGSPLHMHARGKRDRWVDSPYHCGPNRHDSRSCYGPASSRHPTPKNAAAAVVAKLESNGFVVAADGTILRAGNVRSAGQVPRRAAKELPRSMRHSLMGKGSSNFRDGALGMGIGNSREMSPHRPISTDRDMVTTGRYGPGIASTGDRDRHHSRDAPLPLHHQLSRREKSISPHRRPMHCSRSRSPLRPGTRSPRMHTPTRGRNERGMNVGPVHSRSPYFKSQARMQRERSDYQYDLAEHMVSFAPSRSPTSPSHTSRWVDQRKGSPNQFREHQPNRFSVRSPPSRVFSQNKRLDRIDSAGRSKSNEYHRSMHSGTYHDFDRGYDGPGEDRRGGNNNKYEMLSSGRQYDTSGNTKHFRYAAENDFRVHNTRPGPSEFQRRVSPRRFDKGTANQLGDSPSSLKEEKVNNRYVRDGKQNASFKSFGVRDRDDNVAAQRRRPL